ncbi:uncharacterized protein LOC6541090 [Drosophila erecta]|uniref:Uncharacterized protein n=1 Tax=Drosophila erecta TaxID=7220 RepID=B3N371_DROER|nr:uncharacterized protein LOC6541090 [Drosophila erecta]EDV57670.1 uncharacterized protein Dere_GG24403 [Drosophila erecta]
MEEYKNIVKSSDLPHEYVYDDEKPVSNTPPSELNLRDILDSAVAAEAETQTKKLSVSIPPYRHAARCKNGERVYEYNDPRKQSYNSKLWRDAYKINRQQLDIADPNTGNNNLITQIHPCLHRVTGNRDPETCLKCPRCQKPISSTKVLKRFT